MNERRTGYHVVAVRNRPLPFPDDDRRQLMEKLALLRRHAFANQDEPMVRAQQQLLGRTGPFTPVMLDVDAGVVRYRRILERRLQEETAPAMATSLRIGPTK